MVKTGAIPRRGQATSFRVIDGQAVVMQAEGAQVHILNDVGTRVWNLLDGRRTAEEIIDLLKSQITPDEYEQVQADLAADVLEFLADIEGRGMIEMVDGSS